jgi:hypothetical protein
MELGIALLWDKDTSFKWYLSDRGFDCEVVTPRTLAASGDQVSERGANGEDRAGEGA